MKIVKRVNPKSSHCKEKIILFFYCGNHFMMYISQIIVLYTLNLYSVICQLYQKNWKKKLNKMLPEL